MRQLRKGAGIKYLNSIYNEAKIKDTIEKIATIEEPKYPDHKIEHTTEEINIIIRKLPKEYQKKASEILEQ